MSRRSGFRSGYARPLLFRSVFGSRAAWVRRGRTDSPLLRPPQGSIATGVLTLAALFTGNLDQLGQALGLCVFGMAVLFGVTAARHVATQFLYSVRAMVRAQRC